MLESIYHMTMMTSKLLKNSNLPLLCDVFFKCTEISNVCLFVCLI